MSDFYERHMLYSSAIVERINLCKGTDILDAGTGGGFPGIPLTVFFPEYDFTLVGSTGKKVKVVQEIVNTLGLENVAAIQIKAKELKGSHDFVVSRAMTQIQDFVPWMKGKFKE